MKSTDDEPQGYGALGIFSKEEAELESVYDQAHKVGTLDGMRIIKVYADQQIVAYKNKLKEAIGKRMDEVDPVFTMAYYDIGNLIDAQ